MRAFLIRGTLFLIFALVCGTVIFWWLNNTPTIPEITEQAKSLIDSSPAANTTGNDTKAAGASDSFKIPAGGIKLSTLALGESQKKALVTAGINIETFVITEAMVSCGVRKLGDTRATEIFAGATPSLLEIGKLLPCLNG